VRDVVVLGDANVDLVLRGDVVPRFGQAEQLLDAADLTLGGSGSIVACGLATLGLDVSVVAAVGDDPFGDLTLELLRERGVGVDHVVRRVGVPTGLSVILSGAERAILTNPGAVATLTADDVPPALLAQTRHVHAASPYLVTRLRPDLPRLLELARRAGATTSLDTNDDPARRWADLPALLSAADVVLPNDSELLHWARALGTETADWALAATLVAAR
jgi:ribokinase